MQVSNDNMEPSMQVSNDSMEPSMQVSNDNMEPSMQVSNNSMEPSMQVIKLVSVGDICTSGMEREVPGGNPLYKKSYSSGKGQLFIIIFGVLNLWFIIH